MSPQFHRHFLVSLRFALGCSFSWLASGSVWADTIAARLVRTRVAGIDLLAYPTGVKDVVTFRGSIPAGDSFAPESNLAVPTLVGDMLDKGTRRHDKFAIAQALEGVGAQLAFQVDGVMLNVSGKCLRKDIALVVNLLAEQLREPSFPAEELAKLKKQLAGDYLRMKEKTDFQAADAFARAIYPPGHPNYSPPIDTFLAAVDSATLDELRAFHQAYYGPAQMILVVVGDIDAADFQAKVEKAFSGWSGGKARPAFAKAKSVDASRDQVIFMADKPNVNVVLGQSTQLKHSDPDALPLRVANAVFGSGFTGRLMGTVRDREGLTYGIGARFAGDTFSDGDFRITAAFNPTLLEKGLASTRRELNAWYESGITPAELERAKGDMVGSFKVGLATTDGMASALLATLHRGYSPSWLDEFPAQVNGVTLEQVNRAIKAHLNPRDMVLIKAGTVQK